MKIMLVGDLHIGNKNSSDLFFNQFNKFCDFLFDHMQKNDIDTVIQLGDTLDNRKYITPMSLDVINKWFLKFKKHGYTLHTILGNHDIYHKNTSKFSIINQLINTENSNIHVYSVPTTITLDNMLFDFLPWINKANSKLSHKFIDQSCSEYLFAHLELVGGMVSKKHLSDTGELVSIFSHYKTVYSGHYHTKSVLNNVHYIGSPYQLTFNDAQENKSIIELDLQTGIEKTISTNLQMFSKILINSNFDFDSFDPGLYENQYINLCVFQKLNKKDTDRLKHLIDALIKISADLEVSDFDSFDVSTLDLDLDGVEDVMDVLYKLIDNLEIDLDKKSITKKLENLYKELQDEN